MPSAPILNLGARWSAAHVYWRTASKNGRLLGVHRAARRGPVANFAHQTAIYILYSQSTPIYVGQANKALFARLKQHHESDDLTGRWDHFTWFGFRKVIGGVNPSLSKPGVGFAISTRQLLDHVEAVLIHGFEPPLNGQEGRFGNSVKRYTQVRDDRLGPSDRGLLELVVSNGGFLAEGQEITRSGWRSKG